MNNKMLIAVVGIIVVIAAVFLLIRTMNKESVAPADTTETADSESPAITGRVEEELTEDITVVENGMKEFEVTGINFAFDVQALEVKKGDTVKITFTSQEGTHDWRLDEFSTGTEVLAAGESETIEFVADEVGTFEYYCSVGNHRAQGMVGELIVTE